ncbi:restriction endonuclease subunit S [Oceanobacillus sp. FSL K6-3682]|uniref:restriction endonuclease subunit S n=1 Tax=Oceanobacillus sp. FSL K6-3682 TaxID=2921503 RepID=UPI0030DDBB03
MTFDSYKLEDLCEKITDGSHQSPKSVDEGYPMASVKDLTPFGIDLDSCRLISSEDYTKLVQQGCRPEVNDILIAKDGNSCLETVMVQREEQEVVLLSSVAILRPNPSKVDPKYLSLYLSDKRVIKDMKERLVSGSAIPRVILKAFREYEVNLPPIQIQKKISSILGAIDEKLELNILMNQKLEEMAMILYKHWFIDFGPFQEGEFLETELGLIPKDWKIHSIYDLADYINGKAFKTKDLNEQGKLPVIKIAELKSGLSSNTKYYSESYQVKHEINNGDVLFAWSASLGVYLWSKDKALLNQHIFKVQPKEGNIGKPFIYFMLKSLIKKFVQIAASRATTMGHITKEHIVNEKVALPPHEIFEEIQDDLNEYYKLILSNLKETEQLTKIRDNLLPKLLSGEIDLVQVKEVLDL